MLRTQTRISNMKKRNFEMLERLVLRLRVGKLLDPHTFSKVM